MGQIDVKRDIRASAASVWQELADFGGLAGWMPGVQKCEVKGSGIGAVRTISMGPMKVVEKLEAFDAPGRTLSYSIVEGPLPVKNYLATIKVTERGKDACHVDWTARFDTPPGVDAAALAPAVEKGYGGALAALAARLEA